MHSSIFRASCYLGSACSGGVSAVAADDFYKGKTVKLIVSDVPGGGYDAYSRLIAKHIRTYLPGQPNVVVSYMPGADGLVAANHMFNIAEKTHGLRDDESLHPDNVAGGQSERQVQGERVQLAGTTTSYADDSYVLIVRSNMPHHTIDDLRNPAMPLHIGSVGTDVPLILKETLGLSYKIVTGYKGKPELELAIERGETDGSTLGWSSLASRHEDWIKKESSGR